MEYCTFGLRLKDVTAAGITITSGNISMGDKDVPGEWLKFELKKSLKDQPTTVLYKGNLYLVDSREEKTFNCIAIKVENT